MITDPTAILPPDSPARISLERGRRLRRQTEQIKTAAADVGKAHGTTCPAHLATRPPGPFGKDGPEMVPVYHLVVDFYQ